MLTSLLKKLKRKERPSIKTSVDGAGLSGTTRQYKTVRRFINRVGYRSDLGIEFKSSMEANLYRFYTQVCKGIIIKYEPKLFKFPHSASPIGVKGYIPDFEIKVGKFSYFIEAKGRFSVQDLEKTRLFKKYYPGIRLYFVTPKEYNLIKRYYSSQIKGWE
jgi:predicted nuclease of restriction endonuclease-like RecB superfamily